MKRICNIKWLAVVTIFTLGMLFSCKKNNDVKPVKTELLSFGPTGAKPGDTLRFIGHGLDRVTSIAFTGSIVQKTDFKVQTSDLILIILPATTEKGFVTLKSTDGDIVSKTQLNISVSPSVSSFSNQARPGDNITINGNFLNWVNKITFPDNKIVQSFVSKNMTQIVVTVPQDAKTGPLILRYGGTDSLDLQTKDTLNVALPIATNLSPNPIKHSANLTITGTNLDLATQVIFPGVASPVISFISQSATQLVVTVPGSTKSGNITLVAPSKVTTQSAQVLNVLLPVINDMNPNPVNPGSNLTISGLNLDLVTSVSFVGALSSVTSFVSQTASKLIVKVPTGVLKGKISMAVLNSTLIVQSPNDLNINGGLPPLADFPFPIYTDALQNTFQDWSYTDVHDFNNTENVRQGTKSIKAVYASGGYQGLNFHAGTPASTTGLTKLEFSIFGEAGTDGKILNVVINGNYGAPAQVTITGGAWTTYSISMASIGNPVTLGEIVLQSAGWGGTLHIDHVGLR